MDLEILRRAEAFFDGALYIHLARHPLGMIRSYEQGRFLLESPYRGRHDFLRPANGGIDVAHLTPQYSRVPCRNVSAERQMQVRFEDVLSAPEPAMRALGNFLGVGYDPGHDCSLRRRKNSDDRRGARDVTTGRRPEFLPAWSAQGRGG